MIYRQSLSGGGVLACVAALSLSASIALAQGTIAGRVTARATDALPEVRVLVVGTSLLGTTGADGRYTIRNVPAGTWVVRVLRVGYQEQKKSVTMTSGQTETVDFTLEPAIVQLNALVTTATGEQRRVELGNSVSSIDAASRAQAAPTTSMATLLVAQAPGVQVLPGNETGTGSRIRIRGVNSITLANDPIYIIDGVRMTSNNGSQSGNIFTGGAVQSRAEDINPDEIENIEIVKGPSAATLYGTDAANGVVVITTKRGRAGDTRYNVNAETGIIRDLNTYPTAYTLWGHAPVGSTRNCLTPLLSQVSSGLCASDSLTSFNLWSTKNTTPLGTGRRKKGGVQISGGQQALRFFSSGEYEQEFGVFKIPDFDVQRFDTLGIPIKDEWARPSELARGTFRANLDASLSPKLDASFSSGFITSRNRLPTIDNNAYGIGSNGFGGPGYELGHGRALSSLGFELHGYRATTPGESFQDIIAQYINRYIGSTSLNYRPTAWLSARLESGLDFAMRTDQQLCARGTCADVGTRRQGAFNDDRTAIRTITVNGQSTATFQPRPSLNSKTTAGLQWVSSTFDRSGAGSVNLTPGGVTNNAGATQFSDNSTSDSKTLGVFIEEAVGISDRLFLTAGLRSDQNSAFGTKFQQVVYPKVSVSHLLSDESWFPRIRFLDQFRSRLAYGASGVQPGPTDAIQFLSATTTNVQAVDQPGVVLASLGNQDLRPERANEFEGGFDSRWFGSRLTLDLTYYSKITKDALVGAVIPPDLGTGNTTQRTNLGSVKNAGLEGLLGAQLMDRRSFGWDMTLSGSANANKLLTLGVDAQGRPLPAQIGTTTQNRPGYPLFGYWQQRYTFADTSKDRMITLNEITLAKDTTFIAYSAPRFEMALQTGVDLLQRKLRITALFDHKGGYSLLNGTERIRCQSRNNCFGTYSKDAPLWMQARAVAVREASGNTQFGFMENGTFTRFRELSATWILPQRLVARMSAKDASFVVSARNLHTWTKYSGIDPESDSDAGSTISTQTDFQAAPPPTYFIFRLNVTF
ncbi:MAG TPA: SusC/RagA family TonB-linked outer membrane protein [Gemmatimonadaceae bacterium]